MAQNKIRVRLKSYDSTIIDAAAAKVVDVAKRNGSKVAVLFRFLQTERS